MSQIRLRSLIGEAPSPGAGIHQWLFVSALKLHGHATVEEVFECLRAAVQNCGRSVSIREIRDAVVNSAPNAGVPGKLSGALGRVGASHPFPQSRWPQRDAAAIAAVTSGCPNGLERLRVGSGALTLSGWGVGPTLADEVVCRLFPSDPLVCAGQTLSTMRCLKPSEERGFLGISQFIVPSPMTSVTGLNLQGSVSKRSLSNTGPRRFLVVEFDHGTFDQQAAVHIHLARRYPLTLVVHSGGKSLHGWYYVAGQPEDQLYGFMRYAVSLGADQHTWCRCQAVRMPGGLRPSGGDPIRQEVIFFRPTYDQEKND